MSEGLPETGLVVVVNSTEWRNLCARGSLRLHADRATSIGRPPDPAELDRAFASAPTTKIDSSLDLFVLEIRPDWRAGAKTHRAHAEVAIFDIDDVVAHHLVDTEHLDYYTAEATRAGVSITGAAYESAWRRWVRAEVVDAALEAAGWLRDHFAVADDDQVSCEGLAWDTVIRLTRGETTDDAATSRLAQLISSAPAIDDAAAAVRGTEAYLLACCVEWIDLRLHRDALAESPIDQMCRAALSASKKVEQDLQGPLAWETRWCLAALQSIYSDAFSPELPAAVLGPLVSLLADASFRTPSPESVRSTLEYVTREHPAAADVICVIVAAVIGPELVRQLIRMTSPAHATGQVGTSGV